MIILESLFYVLIAIAIIQSIYYLFIFSKTALLRPKATKPNDYKVSVIICAKNEAEQLKTNLPLIVNQDYPDFEIILVNDGSTDSSYDIMEKYSDKYHNVRIVNVEQNETFWEAKNMH